ncbi:hypothetical protein [Streptomyces sp. NPDC050704]|uniref:hypothetical protein n=1 Tax=Streptomyces sp. NPDC050704 TaxID=3157219 RepID=UPI00343ADB2A
MDRHPGSGGTASPAWPSSWSFPPYGVWAGFLATGAADLAAQFAWEGFAARHPDTPYAMFWYGGTHTVNYSVLSPPLMAELGVRTVSVLAGVTGTWLLAVLLERTLPRVSLWPALLGALGLWANVASGRTTFALGVAFGLAGLLVLSGRPVRTVGPVRLFAGALGALGALLATLASPVAGLFLLVAVAGYLLDRQYAKGLVLALSPAAVVTLTTLLFPFQGEQPMAAHRMLTPLILFAAVVWAAPRDWRVVRAGAALYAVGVVLTYLIASPIGTNVERLPALFAPAVLLAALLDPGSGRARATRLTSVPALALAVSVYWATASTVSDLRVSTTVPAWAEHTDQVIAELDRLHEDRGRVEVVPARNHREATLFAPHIQLMRGWNRQLDVERGRLFYDGDFSGPRYHAWLRHWAVGYVVVPNARPDGPALREGPSSGPGRAGCGRSGGTRTGRSTECVTPSRSPRPRPRSCARVRRTWCWRYRGPGRRPYVPRAGVYRLTSSYAAGLSDGHDCRPTRTGPHS